MKKRRIFSTAIIAIALAASTVGSVFAAPVKGNPSDNGPTGDQHTTFGIIQTKKNPGQASFEVPLYVTMAVVDNKEKAIVPLGYDIKNTSPNPQDDDQNTAKADTYPIGVTKMTIERLGDWEIVTTAPDSAKKMQLTIGDAQMPATPQKAQEYEVTLDNSVFKTGGTTQAIPAGKTLAEAARGQKGDGIGITAMVQATTRTTPTESAPDGAVAAFRVRYMVTAFDDAGTAIGNTYIGNNAQAAGYKIDAVTGERK